MGTLYNTRPEAVRFWAKVLVPSVKSCWIWTGATDGKSGGRAYGRFYPTPIGKKEIHVQSHVWAYKTIIGEIPDGFELHHFCRNGLCVNPFHTDPITESEHSKLHLPDARTPMGKNSIKTHCHRGHPFEGKNLYRYPDGRRDCRTCMRLRFLRRKTQNKR